MNAGKPCFHCGEPLPGGRPIFAQLGNVQQPMCCFGCKAVAEFIHASGFDAYYDHRQAPATELGLRVEDTDWQHYDNEDLLLRYVGEHDGNATATVEIGGMYCAACAWLFDNGMSSIPAVSKASVNNSTRRAVIHWNRNELSFAALLGAIARLGFKPRPLVAGVGDSAGDQEQRSALKRLIVAAAAGMQVMMFAVALYAGAHYGIEGEIETFLRVISLLVCIPIITYSARPFFASAWRGLRARSPGMDLPVSVAIAAAFIASTFAVLRGQGDIYFDSVAMFVFFLGATRYLEMRARHRSEDRTTALASLLPEAVTRIRDGEPEVIGIDRLRAGDRVMIRPGDVIPADAKVLSGQLAIDEALLTGEPMPVTRASGMQVFAGSINRSGTASIEIIRVGAGTSLAEVGRLLEEARADKPAIAQLADRIAGKFVIGVLTLTAITGIVWLSLDPSRAFEVVLATLVVTCPCALSLATPAAIAAATSRLARNGFLLVRSRVLQVFAANPVFVFDKTGTLTEGQPAISNVRALGQVDASRCTEIAAMLEVSSEHVLARAFAGKQSSTAEVSDIEIDTGQGVRGRVADNSYRLGKAAYVGNGADSVAEPNDAATYVYLGDGEALLAQFEISDQLRADASWSLEQLARLGATLSIISGDREAAVAAAAASTGVTQWTAGATPDDKLAHVREMQSHGTQVVMVGDGINDAPVLAAADTSVAIDAGTALARASADAIVPGKRLSSLVDGMQVAAATRTIISQNIAWAIGYNVLAVPLAASGMLAPWMAAIGMSASSLLVVLNALRVQRLPMAEAPTSAVTTVAQRRQGAEA